MSIVEENAVYSRRDLGSDARNYDNLKYSGAEKAKFEGEVGYSGGLDRLRYEYSKEKKEK